MDDELMISRETLSRACCVLARFAAENPIWYLPTNGYEQDPLSVHATLKELRAILKADVAREAGPARGKREH